MFYSIAQRKIFWSVFSLCLLWQVLQSVNDFNLYESRFVFIEKTQADIDAHCPNKAIVILYPPETYLGRLINWWDFRRNHFFAVPKFYVKGGGYAVMLKKFIQIIPYAVITLKILGAPAIHLSKDTQSLHE